MIYPNSYPPSEISDQTAEKLISISADCEAYAFKQNVKAELDVKKFAQKQWVKAQEAEYKRSLYHEVVISANGSAVEICSSSNTDDTQHLICNAKHLNLVKLIHWMNEGEQIFQLTGQVNEQPFSVFLDSAKVGQGSYLIRKLSSAGISFYTDSCANQKELARKLISTLITNCHQTAFIYDTPGWYLTPQGTLIFINLEVPKWKKISLAIR